MVPRSMESHNTRGCIDSPASKRGMREIICAVNVSLQEAKCLAKIGKVGRYRCIPSVVGERFPYPAEQAFLTILPPTPDLSLGQCGVDRQNLIDLRLGQGCPPEGLIRRNPWQRRAEILDQHEILLSNQPLRGNPEQPPEGQRSIRVQESVVKLSNPCHSPHC